MNLLPGFDHHQLFPLDHIIDQPPTVGLDIQTRRKIWEYIKKIHTKFDMTIFVSTHYMEEADQLCDRVGIIDGGQIQVIDSPENMKNAMGNEVISIVINEGGNHETFLSEIRKN